MAIPAFLSSMCGVVAGAKSSTSTSLSTFNIIMAVPSNAGELLLAYS